MSVLDTPAQPTTVPRPPAADALDAEIAPEAPASRSLLHRLWTDADLRRSVLSVFDQGVVSGTNFVTSVLIGRLCERSELGVYYLALSVWIFVRGIQDQLVIAPYMIYCSRREGRRLASYLGSSLAHNLLLTVVVAVGLAGLAVATVNGLGPTGLGGTVWVLIGTIPFLMLREFIRGYAFSHLKIGLAITIDVAVSAGQIGGLLWLGWTGHLTVAGAYAVIGVSCALAACGWLLGRTQPMRFARSEVVADWRHNWVFARWALVCHLFTSTAPFLMPWVVAFASGNEATGLLAACSTIIGLANVVVMGLANYLSPKAAHAYGDGGTRALAAVLRKTFVLFTTTLGLFALFTTFAGGTLVTLVYGDGYDGGNAIVALLAFATLASSWGITAGNGLWAMEKPSANLRADVAAFVASVVGTILLVPWLGPLGAALVTLIANLIDAGVRGLTLRMLMFDRRAAEDRAARAEGLA